MVSRRALRIAFVQRVDSGPFAIAVPAHAQTDARMTTIGRVSVAKERTAGIEYAGSAGSAFCAPITCADSPFRDLSGPMPTRPSAFGRTPGYTATPPARYDLRPAYPAISQAPCNKNPLSPWVTRCGSRIMALDNSLGHILHGRASSLCLVVSTRRSRQACGENRKPKHKKSKQRFHGHRSVRLIPMRNPPLPLRPRDGKRAARQNGRKRNFQGQEFQTWPPNSAQAVCAAS